MQNNSPILPSRFNVRVYGVCIENDSLLVTDEIRGGIKMTKLPGGGLEFGEGIEDCLRREFREEMDVEVAVGKILYVNPFFQASAFSAKQQLISLYFEVQLLSVPAVSYKNLRFDFEEEVENAQIFRWIPLALLREEDMTYPVDRALVRSFNAL